MSTLTTKDKSVFNRKKQQALTPVQAVELLKEGNQRFLNRDMMERDHLVHVEKTTNGQFPFAAVLGCIDSRVPAEIIFDTGIGDIFTTRVAGNFVNRDILGSLEFACRVAGSKAILVLGHSSCGAVKGACDGVELGNLTALLSRLKPAVKAIAKDETDYTSADADFVQKVAVKNVEFTVADIRRQSDVLREMEENGDILIVGGMYDVSSGEVKFFDD